jgi:hypothetical protein
VWISTPVAGNNNTINGYGRPVRQKILTEVIDEVIKESQSLSQLDMIVTIRRRYVQRIYAAEQFPAIYLNHCSTDKRGYATRYSYSPLLEMSEIRLLRFEKFVSVGRDYCSCELIHANLEDNPIYCAVSYAWGSVHDTHPILIGDNRFLMVTTSLVEALYRFSTTTSGTKPLIWTDQICIYLDRYRSKCCRNLRFEPQFYEGLVLRI